MRLRVLSGAVGVAALVLTAAPPAFAAAPPALMAAPPAFAAAPAPPEVRIHLRDMTIPDAGQWDLTGVSVWADQPVTLTDAVTTYDYGDLAGVLALELDEAYENSAGCVEVSATVIRCERDELPVGRPEDRVFGEDFLPGPVLPWLFFNAAAGAEVGDTGTMRVTFEAAELAAPLTTTSRVRIGDRVNLATANFPDGSRVPYGGSGEVEIPVTNDSDAPVSSLNLLLGVGPANQHRPIGAAARFANCDYVGDQVRSCAFDQVLAPGGEYVVRLPYAVADDAEAPGWYELGGRWLTRASFEDYRTAARYFGLPAGTPGTGGRVVQLVDATTGRPAPAAEGPRPLQADDDHCFGFECIRSSWFDHPVRITGENGIDLAVTGDSIQGPVGSERTISVALRNVGRAWTGQQHGEKTVVVDIDVPAGTTVVRAPRPCATRAGDELPSGPVQGPAGQRAYRCFYAGDFGPGAVRTFDFRVRVDRAQPTDGRVRLVYDERYFRDVDAANDTAPIRVNRGGSGAGGPLPITGPALGGLLGAGAALVVAGVLLVLIGRRRRSGQ